MTNEQNSPAVAGPVERRVRTPRPMYCPCSDERQDPCPACGATVSGNDLVRGICQATHGATPSNYGISLILIDRKTGMRVEAV